MMEILSKSALTTIQDRGRFGALKWGVGTAGAMDGLALACGNLLLGNSEDAAAIEIQVFPFEARFDCEAEIALTGATCEATIDGKAILPWSSIRANAGSVLRLGLPRSARWRGSRAYVCVAGGIDVPIVLGSRSTQLRGAIGGLEGRALQQGDKLPFGQPNGARRASDGTSIVPPSIRFAADGGWPAGGPGSAGRRIPVLQARVPKRSVAEAVEGDASERPLRISPVRPCP